MSKVKGRVISATRRLPYPKPYRMDLGFSKRHPPVVACGIEAALYDSRLLEMTGLRFATQ